MHGNVWEWVQDCRNGSYSGAPEDGSAWESGNCSVRVLRGGSWYFNYRGSSAPRPPHWYSPPAIGTTSTSVSVLPGRLPLESSPLYLFGGGERGNEDGSLGDLRGFFDFFGRVLWSVRGVFPLNFPVRLRSQTFECPSKARARQTGPALEARYQFILWLVPTQGFNFSFLCRTHKLTARPPQPACHE